MRIGRAARAREPFDPRIYTAIVPAIVPATSRMDVMPPLSGSDLAR